MNIKIRNWILNHDNSKLFKVLYILLALVLSIVISLFWLVAIIFLHYAFDIYMYTIQTGNWKTGLKHASAQMIPDFALILFSFVIVVYIELAVGAAGLSALSRGGTVASSQAGRAASVFSRIGARFAGWQRAIRGVLMSVDDAVLFIKSFWGGVKKPKKDEEKENTSSFSKLGLFFLILFTLMLIFAPLISDKSYYEIFVMIGEELRPY